MEANGLLAKLSDSQFIASFQTIRNFFGYMSGLSKKLQGSSLDVLDGYRMVAHVPEVISGLRSDDNEYDSVFHRMEEMAQLTDGVMTVPRQCSRQSQRSNVPASSAKEYFKRNTYFPYLDSLIQQLDFRFSTLAQQSAQALCLVPSNLSRLNQEVTCYRNQLWVRHARPIFISARVELMLGNVESLNRSARHTFKDTSGR